MKIVVKDSFGKVLFESNKVNSCEIKEDDYDYTKIETTTGRITDTNIRTIKVYRIPNAPEFGKN